MILRYEKLTSPPYSLSPDEAERQMETEWSALAALHKLDQVAGGGYIPSALGDRVINSSIGSTWKKEVKDLQIYVKTISPKNRSRWNMNVTILLDFERV
jgi:hypothetical protein